VGAQGLKTGDAGSVALLTTTANELVARCQDRMPVILPPEAWAEWLGVDAVDAVSAPLRPYPAAMVEARPVGKAVVSVRNECPACLEPAGPAQAALF
jgi:putative SOS response-associated peptidase YedK